MCPIALTAITEEIFKVPIQRLYPNTTTFSIETVNRQSMITIQDSNKHFKISTSFQDNIFMNNNRLPITSSHHNLYIRCFCSTLVYACILVILAKKNQLWRFAEDEFRQTVLEWKPTLSKFLIFGVYMPYVSFFIAEFTANMPTTLELFQLRSAYQIVYSILLFFMCELAGIHRTLRYFIIY